MKYIVVMTGFQPVGFGLELYRLLGQEREEWDFVDGCSIYQKLITGNWNHDPAARKCLLMATEQVVIAKLLEALRRGQSVVIDLSWIPKCPGIVTDMKKVGKKIGCRVIWVQGGFTDVQQYKDCMRQCVRTQNYICLFARHIRDGQVWGFRQERDWQALDYGELPFQCLRISGTDWIAEGKHWLCMELKGMVSQENIKTGGC